MFHMKKILTHSLMIILVLAPGFIHAQRVGIGTTSPSNNAVLDVTSADKGLLLPRLADTGVVSNPSAGLLIYNQKTGTPAFHDGNMWRNLFNAGTSMTNTGDSVTYTITNATQTFVNGTFSLLQLTHGGTTSGTTPNINTLFISKLFDANTIPFKRLLAYQAGTASMIIEFKVYSTGAATPYFSVKLTSWRVTEEGFSATSPGGQLAESYSFAAVIIGFKDWINNKSFAWNNNSALEVTY